MEKRVIYPNNNGGISILIPAMACGLTIEQIAQKDVPYGVPYLIVEADVIPSDRTYRNAWTADFSLPDGHGGGFVPEIVVESSPSEEV